MPDNEEQTFDWKCKKCGGGKILPVVYGLPLPDTFARAIRGEILLGGCVMFGNEPDYKCGECFTVFTPEPFDEEIW
jgi:hypothetical protein